MKVAILGGGLAGISAAYHAEKNGHEAVIIEKEKELGGIARSIKWKGCIIDYGPHRFHTKVDWVEKLFKELMGKDLLVRKRLSRIYTPEGFIPYPPKPEAILKQGKKTILKIGFDYVTQKIKNKILGERKESLKDWGVNRFGETLYEIYFGRYNRKIWGVDPSMISYDWGNQRVDGLNMKNVIKKALGIGKAPRTFLTKFYYPKYGAGSFTKKFAKKVKGNKIAGSKAVKVKKKGDKWEIVHEKGTLKADKVISTIRMDDLIGMLEGVKVPKKVMKAAGELKYRSSIFVHLLVKKNSVSKDSWIYYHDPTLVTARVTQQKNFSPYCVPKGKTVLTCEIFSNPGEEPWEMSDKELIKKCEEEVRATLIGNKVELLVGKVIKYPKTYPLFLVGTEKRVKTIKDYLESIGIISTGRMGSFYHTNMDHSIIMGRKAVEMQL